MKRLAMLLCLMGVFLVCAADNAIALSYETYFETEALRDDWTSFDGSWEYSEHPTPVVPGHNLYVGNPDPTPGATGITFFNQDTQINTTNLNMNVYFAIPSSGVYTGVFFGSHPNEYNYYDDYTVGVSIINNELSIYYDLMNQTGIEHVGYVTEGDQSLGLSITVDENDILTWYIVKKTNDVWADTAYSYGMFYNPLESYTGTVGLWTSGGGTAFGKVELNYGDTAPVPEPATILLLSTGLLGIAGIKRRNK